MYTIKSALTIGNEILSKTTIDAPLNDARLLLGFILSVPKTTLIAYPEKQISNDLYQKYLELINQRFQGMPLAYLTGIKEFWGLALKVNSATLIPRPDTEILIETVLQLEKIQTIKAQSTKTKNCATFNILDLGTGTGAIALALKHELPFAHVFACDQNIQATELAILNATTLGLNINIRHSNWFDAYHSTEFYNFFDLIIANPPYIDENDPHLLADGIKFEPLSALTAKNTGLADIQHIINEAPIFLKKDAFLVLEHGYNQGNDVRHYYEQSFYRAIQTYSDWGGNDRCTLALAPNKMVNKNLTQE